VGVDPLALDQLLQPRAVKTAETTIIDILVLKTELRKGRWRWTNRMTHRILVIEKESRMTQLTTQRCAPSIAVRRSPRAT
jgi:hypothetical protein